ncbi:MAG: helix-turn-helix domain-containing protein [Acidimicrobiia bacterium]
MPDATLVEMDEARYSALADPVRRRILRLLEDAAEPRDVGHLASLVDLHSNTVRGHMDVLERAGLVSKTSEVRNTPGRPRMLYGLAPDSEPPAGSGYRLLSEILATALRAAVGEPREIAVKTGRKWGLYLTERPSPLRPLSPEDTTSRITEMLADFGFAPEQSTHDATSTVIELRDCPFRDLARTNADVVCSIHLGLMRGAAEALGGRTLVTSLDPFVEPSMCRVLLQLSTSIEPDDVESRPAQAEPRDAS